MNVRKVIVSDIIARTEGNIITPVRRVRLILSNGAIFDREFWAYVIEEAFVVKNYEEEPDKWKKYEANEKV